MLQLVLQSPKKSLSPAHRKMPVTRNKLNAFKTGLQQLFEHTTPGHSEETLKNRLHIWLSGHDYEPQYHVSVNKDRQDMSIHLGKNYDHAVGVILETKSIGSGEMPGIDKPNVKALHELILYYLQERINNENFALKYLVATDFLNWVIIDANEFDKKIMGNPTIRKLFDVHGADGKTNDFFYRELKTILDKSDISLQATGFHLNTYKNAATNSNDADDEALVPLFKILSPNHLLKLAIANDSNYLDKDFYNELLHLLGLKQIKDKGKQLIRRKEPGERQEASLLENALIKLQDKEALRNLDVAQRVGDSPEEQYFNLALELCITWVNRILFMKLLEAQLLSYHNGQREYRFMQPALLHDFDELNNLFFQVLAELPQNRRAMLQQKFAVVPYLNSSLFERTELERKTIDISALDNQLPLPLFTNTVLKDSKGKKQTGGLPTLEYLLAFLDAYNFSGEGSGEIREDNKTLINASVLGLIFEKINGYKDGSFFTPGFITMYMCRQTIRQAVLSKFNNSKGWQCTNLDELYDRIDNRGEANDIINSLHICDPAVGSGHFLVSALNELIHIKHDLKILQDRQGRRLKEYQLSIDNDELAVMDEEGNPFRYIPGHPESQRVQETLFHEKQTLIENCLFGVDINPNSVKICRLRLWIELLKSAYYKRDATNPSPVGGGWVGALETLPNIDINIKTGNSLVSRFALEDDLSHALNKSAKWNIDSYKLAVQQYKHAQSKAEKRELEDLIDTIKKDFKSEVSTYDPINKELNKLRKSLLPLTQNQSLFGDQYSAAEKKKQQKELETISSRIDKLEAEKEALKDNVIYRQAFEWRFEFPELLDGEGNYMGFDAIIGNPPYIRQEAISWMKPWLQKHYETYTGTADLYVFFVEKGMQLLRPGGQFCCILPNKWMKGGYGRGLRQWAAGRQTLQMLDFGDLPVFEEATTYPSIWQMQNNTVIQKGFKAAIVDSLDFENGLEAYLEDRWLLVDEKSLAADSWNLVDSRKQALLDKIKAAGKPLGEYVNGKIYYGIKTGYNEAFVIDSATREQLITADPKSAEIIRPFLAGRDIKRYQQPKSDKWLIFTRRGIEIENYPAVFNYLLQFKERLEPKPTDYKKDDWLGRKPGTYKWYEIQDAVDYYSEFEKPKILLPDIAQKAEATFDDNNLYCTNTAYIIPTDDFSLAAFLNSKITLYFYGALSSTIRGGYYRFIRQYLEQIPIAKLTDSQNESLKSIVQQLLLVTDLEQKIQLEANIDALMYEAYGLTEEERESLEAVN